MSTKRLFRVLTKPTLEQITNLIDKKFGYHSTDEWHYIVNNDRRFQKFLAAYGWNRTEFVIRTTSPR